jgi:hypothetical protein
VNHVPPVPPGSPRASAHMRLRFEDITQDGRMVLEALPTALAPTVWRGLLAKESGAQATFARGIVPILTRFVLEGTPGPFSANATVDAEGTFGIARVVGSGAGAGAGVAEQTRIVLDMWAELHAPIGRTYGAADREGERALAGRVYAEHVFTRPFAPPEQRRVLSLDFDGAPVVPPGTRAPRRAESIVELPEGATPLEPETHADPLPVVFGVVHTDSNQHVNSLAYVRMFEEAALRRLAALGRSTRVLGRAMEIAYRRPCFAGEALRVAARAYETDGKPGVVATLVSAAESSAGGDAASRAKPRAFARMSFE